MKNNALIIKLKVCKWCGREFIKTHNRQIYCSKHCSKYARQEKNRGYFRKYYHKYKETMHEEERFGLGSGYLSMHRHNDFHQESIAIRKEMQKLKIK
jgi:hypothetical protein